MASLKISLEKEGMLLLGTFLPHGTSQVSTSCFIHFCSSIVSRVTSIDKKVDTGILLGKLVQVFWYFHNNLDLSVVNYYCEFASMFDKI